jgi:hypothetical protein
MQILQDRIIYDENDWLGGLVPQAANSVALTVGKGAAYQRNINPFKFLGGICPGEYPAAATNVASITQVIQGGDVCYKALGTYAYLVGGALIHQLDLNVINIDVISNTAPWPHTIDHGHVSEYGNDLKIFTIVNGVSSTSSVMALYSFIDATDGDVGAFDTSSALPVFYDNFLSTQPTGAFTLTKDRHPMIVGDDGALYIGNGNSLAKLVGDGGGNGTLSTPLSFPTGTVIKSFTKYPDYLIIFAERNSGESGLYRGNSFAYFWNYQSQNFNFIYDLADNIVTSGGNWLGTPFCFTYGRAGNGNGGAISTKLKIFNGTKFEQVLEYDGEAPGHGAVEIYNGMITWSYGNAVNGFMVSYGSPWPGRIPNSFNYISEPSGVTNLTGGGFCSNLMQNKLYVCSGTGANGGLEIFGGSGFGPLSSNASYFRGVVAQPSFPSQMMGKIKSVKVHFRKLSTAGRTLKLELYFNGTTTYSTVFTGVGTLTSTVKENIFDSNNIEYPYFHGVFPVLTWDSGTSATDAPIVNKIEIFYEPVKKFIQ